MAQKPPFLPILRPQFHQIPPVLAQHFGAQRCERYCCRGRWLQWHFGLRSSALPDWSLGATEKMGMFAAWGISLWEFTRVISIWDIYIYMYIYGIFAVYISHIPMGFIISLHLTIYGIYEWVYTTGYVLGCQRTNKIHFGLVQKWVSPTIAQDMVRLIGKLFFSTDSQPSDLGVAYF